jgi:hypothetical protein
MQSTADLIPIFLLLGFAVVGVFLATLLIIWIAVWRAVRRGDAASKPREPRTPKGAPGRLSRRRLFVLAAIGAGGGALVGAALSALAAALAANARRPGAGHVGARGQGRDGLF